MVHLDIENFVACEVKSLGIIIWLKSCALLWCVTTYEWRKNDNM